MKHTITLIPGDGTGPEITETVVRVLEATGLKIEWDVQEAGSDVLEKYGTPLPNQVLESIKRNKVALKGPITTPVGTGFRSVNVALRKELDLFACLRPCKTYPGVRSRYENIDLVIIRENTEDLYAGIEFEVNQEATTRLIQNIKELSGHSIRTDTGLSIKPISIFGSKRIVTFAFEYARQNNRRKVTAVHKANIMKYSDGLFLQVARQVASNYPDIEFEDRIVDNMCMQLVQKPELYDVLVLPNLYGDILSDLGAGLVGGLGVAPGANIGTDYAVFEPTHGSAPKYKNQNKVNPMAMILSGMMMLQYIGEKEKAQKLEKAVAKVIQENRFVTYDMKPISNQDQAAKTNEVGEAIIRALTK
ncbi:MAG: isocitrate/isopropylmalate dehydrogenase family protein [Atribacter sp.]|jgi:isocitrate dehydrogenase (NAD+)|uniref:isocitrate/isopropylmalate dehydrogenase family protein n=1 Tax=Atribacter sp. TaxID=2847780 RepID=UPI00175B01CD|nr:isocitrate/isopropylmalate dehydrogenase family protein [Atribacterota bacterium]HHT09703.1 isocitrate/isopropylmalate dehydrogenase family protein [Candidatus Atribacteria bacterium]